MGSIRLSLSGNAISAWCTVCIRAAASFGAKGKLATTALHGQGGSCASCSHVFEHFQVPRLYICVYVNKQNVQPVVALCFALGSFSCTPSCVASWFCFVESDIGSLFCVRRRCRSTLLLAAMVASVVHYSGLVLPQIAVLQGSVCGLTAQL